MRLALYQATSPAGNIPAGLSVVDGALAGAAAAGADMLVMPEAFLPGYNAVTTAPPAGWAVVHPALADMCRRHRTGLTIGLPDYTDGAVFNTALTLADDGTQIASYRKIQLFGDAEAALYTPGDQLVTFDFRGTRFGLLICYDVEFPEHTRALARAGAEVILVPTANMMPFVNVNQIVVPARAAESAITIVYANYCGAEGALTYTGLSGIFGPDGYALAAKGTNSGLIVEDVPDGWSEHGIPAATQLTDLRPAKEPT